MSRSIKDVLNESNPNKLPNAMQALPAGNAFGLLPRYARVAVVSNVATLPEDAKAAQILSAFVVAGTLTGQLTVVKQGTTPTTGNVAVNVAGNIAFASADVVTSADIWYVPIEGTIYEDEIVVASSSAVLPFGRAGIQLLSANILAGLSLGTKTILARGATPSAGQVALNLAGTSVVFNASDVVAGRVRVRYVSAPGIGTNTPKSINASLSTQVDY